MGLADEHSQDPEGLGESRHRVRLPRFLVHEPVGLGSTIQRVTDTLGVTPCSSCEERAAHLNRWVSFEPRR
jgi:hypothetical protein